VKIGSSSTFDKEYQIKKSFTTSIKNCYTVSHVTQITEGQSIPVIWMPSDTLYYAAVLVLAYFVYFYTVTLVAL
jgi:hypothetical protein